MGIFTDRKNNGGIFSGLHAQITRQDVRNGPNYPINIPTLTAQTPPGPPPGPGGPNPDPRMNTAEARRNQQAIDRSSRGGTLGAFVAGGLGTLAGAALGGPVGAILGSGAGSMLGGGVGQALGGVTPDLRDLAGYGVSGLAGGAAGGLASGLAGQAGGAFARLLGTQGGGYLAGRMGLSAASNALGLNSEYDPRYRYFVNPNNREIQSAY